jgi:ABC-type antimicrobial peptide transport system permease subunit
MFKTYFKIAWRNLWKNKTSSFINISGLAIGMAVVMLIGLWIWNELSFDTTHKNYKHIAKIRQNITVNGNTQTQKTVPLPLAEELRNRYGSYFKYIVMSSHRLSHVLSFEDKNLTEPGVFFGPQGPEMLTLNMLKGTRNGLNDSHSILLSESAAKTYFGDEGPVNKVMKIDNKMDVKVTGVYEDLPDNSTFGSLAFIAPFQLYLNSEEWLMRIRDQWKTSPVQAYVQIADNADMNKVSEIIRNIKFNKVNADEKRYKPEFFLEPMSKWHLYAEYINGVNTGGKIQYIWMFGIIGFFVLLLACINFMNLSTARSQKRSKEVGIRKTIGSSRIQLIKQFFIESFLMVIIAFGFSLVLTELLLPFFNSIADKNISIPWSNYLFWLLNICFILFAGLIAGSYPAFYLSSFKPVKVLKGTFKAGSSAAMPRKILVVFQFTASVVLIIGTIIIFRQIQFAKNRPIGYNTDGLIVVPMFTKNIPNHFDALKDELLKTGAVKEMALSEGPITDVWGTDNDFNWKGKDPGLTVDFPNTGVSVDYGKTVGWQFLEGRDFSKHFPSDSSAFVINEAAVKFMNLKNPVGEIISCNEKPYTIIGVIKDVIVESPYEPVRPSLFCMARSHDNYLIIKMNPAVSAGKALATIGTLFKKYDASQPFNYKFVDEQYAKKFNNEQRVGSLASFFAILAIFISCLGLFGMACFMAEQRTKEIGVRKILGASILDLWQLLSKEFVILVFISLIVAIPVAYYFMHNWLQNYQYRTNLSWWIFAVAGVGSLMITLITVSFQAIKAAIANPVNSLRSE